MFGIDSILRELKKHYLVEMLLFGMEWAKEGGFLNVEKDPMNFKELNESYEVEISCTDQ